MKLAKAHSRMGCKYSDFHQSLVQALDCTYALHLLYSTENAKHVLLQSGYNSHLIKEASEYLTIDVQRYCVRLHVPRWIPVKRNQIKQFSVLNGCKVIEGKLHRPIDPVCSFFSKKDFLEALIERNQAKSDPYKVFLSQRWDELTHQGIEENHTLLLDVQYISCNCKAYFGLLKAFGQDPYMFKLLTEHPVMNGQIPEKHVFSVWRHLGCRDHRGYRFQYELRRLAAHGLAAHYFNLSTYSILGTGRNTIGSVTEQEGLWYNAQFLSRYRELPGDGIGYPTLSECAIALAEMVGERLLEEQTQQFLHPKVVSMDVKRAARDPFYGISSF
jgi:hypothetical protein